MSAILGNGTVTFGDGTSLSTANIPYGNITGVKTNLSQFVNDLGNYGGFWTSSSINGASTTLVNAPTLQLGWNGSQLTLTAINCQCVCNC